MNQKKNKKILIIAIIAMFILIVGVGCVYAYIATDIFRSDKELFFKYITQIGDSEKGFINNDVIQYFEKRKNTSYETSSNISFNITDSDKQEQFENTNKCNIVLTGKVDNQNSKSSQEIKIKYSEDVIFPLYYQKVGNIIGLKTQYVGSKFIGVETDQLNNLQENMNDIQGNTPTILKYDNTEITNEQLQYIKDTYFNILNQELKDTNFSKIEENQKGYKLSLTGEELKNLIIKLLETLKNDQITLDKINEYFEINSKNIDEQINELNNNSEINNQKFEMIIYINNKTIQKINILTNEASIAVEKIESGDSKQYNISCELYEDNNTTNIYLNTKYSGLQSLQMITENYELGIQTNSDAKYVYYLNNEVNFVDSVEIDDLNDNNTLLLTKLESEQVTTLINAITERIIEVNKQQMENLGLTEDKNPLQYIIPSFVNPTSMEYIENDMSELEINTFNKKFEMYESTNLKGVTVKGLLSTILNNNTNGQNKKITEINFDGKEYDATEENITLIKSEIKTEETYRVEFERNENTGLIYRTVISKK